MPEDCIFCKIVSGQVQTAKIYEDDLVIAMLDIFPASPGQSIVIPKKHYEFLSQASPAERSRLFKVASTLCEKLPSVVKCEGMTVVCNQGPAASQRVSHLAVQVIPRSKGDEKNIVVGWNPNQELQKVQLQEVHPAITKAMQVETIVEEEKPVQQEKPKEVKKEDFSGSTWFKRRIP